ncbi:MAG TPA: hypothetical protein DCR43_06670 [Bacteroidales bacterium]|nr:MAG: hypothetical protein A2X11_16145 [Bacteroidetes bacterium GWE2_42_24]OFY29198.1 MAG: hypothetical protein A2X09_05690 [Bacteroidetes bacterium GWF2_43_11]HAQ65518.1 hypothetical protein [Bacteroidales bacterium]HBZ66820.1 hypothetical protein [Bacteroidales bacterium]
MKKKNDKSLFSNKLDVIFVVVLYTSLTFVLILFGMENQTNSRIGLDATVFIFSILFFFMIGGIAILKKYSLII